MPRMRKPVIPEKEKNKTGKRRGRPRKPKPIGVKNTGGGLPFFNPYGGQ